jgi:hypothetical protein
MKHRKMKQAGIPPSEDPHDVRPEYLRRDEAARFVGLAPATMANMASAGRGPSFYRVGSRVLYEISELRRFVEAGRVEMAAGR